MDNILKIKISLIALYLGVAVTLFYNEHFLNANTPLYIYGNLEFIIAILSLGVILSSAIYHLAFYYHIRNCISLLCPHPIGNNLPPHTDREPLYLPI